MKKTELESVLQAIFDCLPGHLEAWRQERARNIGNFDMPFGKYKGKSINNVPLKYLDQTIGTSGDAWFVNAVRQFVESCMEVAMDKLDMSTVPNMSWCQIIEAINEVEPDWQPWQP